MQSSCWYLSWLIGSAVFVPIFYYLTRRHYFQGDANKFTSVYKTWSKAQVSYISSLIAICYACYILASLLIPGAVSTTEAAIHLAIWTIGPPLWLSYERYFFFDQRDDEAKVKAMKEGQDYASKFWAAILAVMLAFQLGQIVKSGLTQQGVAPEKPASASLRQFSGELRRWA